ncbi:hypothetical protein DFH28DRAFT_888685 [Melampsora americana]|nr:hypothetical protein DFH28DRAFT_888685 [Melampsora americana]
MPSRKTNQTTNPNSRSIKDYFQHQTTTNQIELTKSIKSTSIENSISSTSYLNPSPSTRSRSRQQEERSSQNSSSIIQTQSKPKSNLTPIKSIASINQENESDAQLLNSERPLTRSSTKPLEESNTPTKRNTRSSSRLSDMNAPSGSSTKKPVSKVARRKVKDDDQSKKNTKKSSLKLPKPLKAPQPVTKAPELTIDTHIAASSPLTDLDEPLNTEGSKVVFPGTLPPSGPQTSQSGLSSPPSPLSLAPVLQLPTASASLLPPTSSLTDDDDLEDPDTLFISRVEQNLQDSPTGKKKKASTHGLPSSIPRKKSTRILPSRPIYNPQIHSVLTVQRASAHSLESMIKSVKAAEKRTHHHKRSHEEYLRLGCDQLEIPEELPERFTKRSDRILNTPTKDDRLESSLMEIDDEELEEISKEDVEKIGVLPMMVGDRQGKSEKANGRNERNRKLKEQLLKGVEKGERLKKLKEDQSSRSIFIDHRFSSNPNQSNLVSTKLNLTLEDELSRLQDVNYDVDKIDKEEKAVLEEMIDYLNHGWTHPDSVPVDLLTFLPPSLMQPSADSLVQRLILEILFRVISNPTCPVELSYKCLINFSKGCEMFKVKMDENWQDRLRLSLLSLGIKPQYLKSSTDQMEVDLRPENIIAPLKETIHTLRSILQMIEILLSSGCLSTELAQSWILPIILRLTIDPHTSELTQDLSNLTLYLLSAPLSNSTASLLIEEIIEIGRGLKSWRSRMELVKRIPNELEFRKWSAMVMIDLVEEKDSDVVKESIGYIVRRSRAFTVSPSARELYNLVIDAHPKYSDLFIKEDSTYSASYQLRKIFKEEREEEEMGEVIGLIQIGLHGLWDYLCDEKNKKEIKIKLKDGENMKGNLWMMKLWDGLKEFETSINTMGYGTENIEERFKLKNLVTGLMMMIKFQDEEAVQQVKNIYRDGQMKLDRFVLRK